MSIILWSQVSPEIGEALKRIAALIAALVSAYYIADYRRRAASRDHVYECTNDFAVPTRCLNCASPDAPFTFVVASVLSFAAWNHRKLYGTRRRFQFHFCLACARPMRRRKHRGTVMIVLALVLPPAWILSSILAPRWVWTHVPWQGGDVFWLMFTVTLLLSAPIFIVAGIRLQDTSPSVVILDTGEGTLLFRFRSQMSRNYFAELNGEDFRKSDRPARAHL